LYFAERFNIEKQKKYPYMHAEISAIQKVWSKVYIDNSVSIVVLRLSRNGTLQNSKPCKGCSTILTALGIDDVCWSNASGDIVHN
jgi:cytidine deaminase